MRGAWITVAQRADRLVHLVHTAAVVEQVEERVSQLSRGLRRLGRERVCDRLVGL
jgi:hypothetical protein